jgi:hypothetical protein
MNFFYTQSYVLTGENSKKQQGVGEKFKFLRTFLTRGGQHKKERIVRKKIIRV